MALKVFGRTQRFVGQIRDNPTEGIAGFSHPCRHMFVLPPPGRHIKRDKGQWKRCLKHPIGGMRIYVDIELSRQVQYRLGRRWRPPLQSLSEISGP